MALTSLYCTGWEHQTLAVSTAALGAPTTAVDGTQTINTTDQRTGAACLEVAKVSGTANDWRRLLLTAGTKFSLRFYMRLGSVTTAGPCALMGIAAGNNPALFINTSSVLGIGYTTTGSLVSGPTLTTGQWYLVEWQVDVSTNPNNCYLKVDDTLYGVASLGQAASTVSNVMMGTNGTTGAYTMQYDDLIFGSYTGTTGADPGDWWGAGEVRALRPSGIGTHSLGTDTYQKTGAVAVTGADTDSYLEIDDTVLVAGTDYVSQTAPAGPGGTTYLDYTIDQLAADVATVQHVAGYCSVKNVSGTQGNAWKVRTTDGTNFGDIFTGSIASASQVLRGNQFALNTAGGAWDRTTVNALHIRNGYSTDASPNPQTHGVLLEVAVTTGAAVTPAIYPSMPRVRT